MQTPTQIRGSLLGRSGKLVKPLKNGVVVATSSSLLAYQIATDLSLKGFFASGRQGALANAYMGRTQKHVMPQGLICGFRFHPGGFARRLMYHLHGKPAPCAKGILLGLRAPSLASGLKIQNGGLVSEMKGFTNPEMTRVPPKYPSRMAKPSQDNEVRCIAGYALPRSPVTAPTGF